MLTLQFILDVTNNIKQMGNFTVLRYEGGGGPKIPKITLRIM
jgi:hypothetical protein